MSRHSRGDDGGKHYRRDVRRPGTRDPLVKNAQQPDPRSRDHRHGDRARTHPLSLVRGRGHRRRDGDGGLAGGEGKVSRSVQIAQSPQGHADLHAKLGAQGVPAAETLVVLEATGSYWITLATTLAQ